ncbi:MAG: hypothetical protein EGR16_07030 [Clostridiales bacterium]|nr:hypothetical protein [Clostridiales bacterium]
MMKQQLLFKKMVTGIKNAYIKRFANNKWMSEGTKQNAIKKVNNIVSVIGYKDNLANPVIVSPENGGTYFNNSVRIRTGRMLFTNRFRKKKTNRRRTKAKKRST